MTGSDEAHKEVKNYEIQISEENYSKESAEI